MSVTGINYFFWLSNKILVHSYLLSHVRQCENEVKSPIDMNTCREYCFGPIVENSVKQTVEKTLQVKFRNISTFIIIINYNEQRKKLS